MERKAEQLFIRCFSEISKCEQFLQLSHEALINYLTCDELSVESELEIILAITRWLNFDPERKALVHSLTGCVRTGLLLDRDVIDLTNQTTACPDTIIKQIADYHENIYLQPFEHAVTNRPRNSCKCVVLVGGYRDIYGRDLTDNYGNSTRPVAMNLIHGNHGNLAHFNLGSYFLDASSVELNNFLFVIGGMFLEGGLRFQATDEVWRYSAGRDEWLPMAAMQQARAGHVSMVIEEAILVIGGSTKENDENLLDSCEVYNIRRNTWSHSPSLPRRLTSAAGCCHGNRAYIAGGLISRRAQMLTGRKCPASSDLLLLQGTRWISLEPMSTPR